MVINKTCRTCEFNFDNICAGDGNYKYGEMIASVYKGIHIKTTKNGLPTY